MHQLKNRVVSPDPPPVVPVRSSSFSFPPRCTAQFFFPEPNRASFVSPLFGSSLFIRAPHSATDCVATRPTSRIDGAGKWPSLPHAGVVVQRTCCSLRVACETPPQGVSRDNPLSTSRSATSP